MENKKKKTKKIISKNASVPQTKSVLAASTIIFLTLIILIILILPKYSVIELDVFAKQVNFSLLSQAGDDEEIPLIHSGLWTGRLHLENFDQFEINISSIISPMAEFSIQNPIRICPNSSTSRINFSGMGEDVSVQELFSYSPEKLTYKIEDGCLSIRIQDNRTNLFQTIGLNEKTIIEVQDCSVYDNKNLDLTSFFNQPVILKLHPLSRSLILSGVKKKLGLTLENVTEDYLFIFNQQVQDVDFNKQVLQHTNSDRLPTIDSIFVKRKLPYDKITFKNRGLSSLDLEARPNKFLLFELSKQGDFIKFSAQGKFRFLKIGRGMLKQDMVPYFISLIINHPALSILISFLGWLIPIIVPIIFKIRKREL